MATASLWAGQSTAGTTLTAALAAWRRTHKHGLPAARIPLDDGLSLLVAASVVATNRYYVGIELTGELATVAGLAALRRAIEMHGAALDSRGWQPVAD
jgi:hypothetical protein